MNPEQIQAKARERRRALEERAARAERARLIVESPLLSEAFEEVEKTYYEGALAETNEQRRNKILTAINGLRAVRKHLEAAIEDGHQAQIRLQEITGKRWL